MNSFTESQKFNQKWVWGIVVVACLLPLFKAFRGHVAEGVGRSLGTAVGAAVLGPFIVFVVFKVFRLDTQIDESGVSYRLAPIHRKMVLKKWEDIERAYVRQYKPIWEYGGWGMRYSLRNGDAYNVSGNMGLQLVMKNGKKILIGTQKPDEVNTVLAGLVRAGVIDGGCE